MPVTRPAKERICAVRECVAPSHTRDWCRNHYRRWLAYGDPTTTLRDRAPIAPGTRFGKLVVLEVVGVVRTGPTQTHRRYLCRCDCGNTRVVRSPELKGGDTKSCGCLAKPHGFSDSPTYTSWRAMKRRCTENSRHNFKYYGGRGVVVCERWSGPHDFANFLADMGERPEGKSIDRIDPDGDYEPGNCRWATAEEQANNKRPRAC